MKIYFEKLSLQEKRNLLCNLINKSKLPIVSKLHYIYDINRSSDEECLKVLNELKIYFGKEQGV